MWKIWDEVEGIPNCRGFQDRDWVRGVGFSGSGGKLGCGRNGTKAKGPAAGASPPTQSPSIMTADTGLETQGTGVDVEWTFDFGNSMEGSRTRTRGGWTKRLWRGGQLEERKHEHGRDVEVTKRLWRGGQLEERIQEHVVAQSPPWPPKIRYTRSRRDFGVVISSR